MYPVRYDHEFWLFSVGVPQGPHMCPVRYDHEFWLYSAGVPQGPHICPARYEQLLTMCLYCIHGVTCYDLKLAIDATLAVYFRHTLDFAKLFWPL